MALELYHSGHSTCSQKVRLCLAGNGLDWISHEMNFSSRDHLQPEYLKLNPNGVVPTLVHDGKPVIESSVICEYLDDVFSEPPLAPRDTLGKAHMRAWLCYMNEVPTVAVRIPSFNMVFRPLRYENCPRMSSRRMSAICRCARRSIGAWESEAALATPNIRTL